MNVVRQARLKLALFCHLPTFDLRRACADPLGAARESGKAASISLKD